jgi:plastocyanin
MPAPFNHSSGLPAVYDRTPDHPDWTRVLFREDKLTQAAELMEMQSIIEGRGRRVGNLVANDGDRIAGADILVNVGASTVQLAAGRVYVAGDVREIAARTLTSVTMSGDIKVGIRIVRTVITEADEPDLLGLHPGSEAEGEAGAGREVETLAWGWSGDGEPGELYPVYSLKDGTVIDQTPPPNLTGINQAIAIYDDDANGDYVVRGCRVTALGKISGSWHFSISEGVANINGFKRTREAALRHIQADEPDLRTITSEPHSFVGTSPNVITTNNGPINAVTALVVEKQVIRTITKGAGGATDAMPDGSITTIVEVKQGGTTYIPTTDYVKSGDGVSWAPAGAEPAPGSSYTVEYRYLDAVSPDATTSRTVTVSGGFNGGSVFITYTYKLPRIDLLCLNQDGNSVYIKGVSAIRRPLKPRAPSTLLGLAWISNIWDDKPLVEHVDVRSVTYEELWFYLRKLWDTLDLVALERLRRDIDSREPVAKKGVFVDPFESDFYRDAGEVQTAALVDGFMRLAIDPTFFVPVITQPIMLDYTETVLIRQDLATFCMKINPYQNFEPLPGALQISPASDFWVETETDWLSDVTREFTGTVNRQETVVNLEAERTERIEFLRQITINFTITGMGAGEILTVLTFDGVSVLPGGTPTANGSGVLTGSFAIPANIASGVKQVYAEGAGGTAAWAQFAGQGTLEVDVMRRVTTIWRAPPPRPVDPLAQSFTPIANRHITGIDVKFCLIGSTANGCIVQCRVMENGFPTQQVLAEAFVDMAGVVLNTWHQVRFRSPLFVSADREFCIVLMTDDANHSVSAARIGDFDAANQSWVAAQPYTVGVLFSSSNASTWTPQQTDDLTMRVPACVFSPTSKTVNLGSFAVTNMSDLIIRAAVDLPTADCRVTFEVERASGARIYLLPNQPFEFTEFVTETIILRAILVGTANVSPTLFPGVLMIVGTLRSSGTYISRAFEMGSSIRMSAFYKALLPAGSAATLDVDAADDSWTSVGVHATEVLNDGNIEREHRVTPYTATVGRLRVTITGTPAARPLLSDLRAVSI